MRSRSPARRVWVSEKVDRIEQGLESTDDELHLTPRSRARATGKLHNKLATESDTASEDDVEVTLSSDPATHRALIAADIEKKIEWSDDDDGEDVYKQFKSRKRKSEKPAPRRGKQNSTIVGRRATKLAKTGKTLKARAHGDESSDDAEDKALPEYLRKRRNLFDTESQQLDKAGLRLPPDYDGVEFSDDERLEALEEKPNFTAIKPCAPYEDVELPYSGGVIPAPIAQWLRDYQRQGASFLHELFVYQKGGLLGDDMGLGKTIQVIACLTAAYGKTADERDFKRMRKVRRASGKRWYPRTLIICPGSLMENWRSELAKWGWWNVEIYHGDYGDKEITLQTAAQGRLEVMITTYTSYKIDKNAINMIPWDCVIADECHAIKGRKSEITLAMHEVNALCRIGLTGTAIQNNYDELYELLHWTNPGRFGPLSAWKATVSEPLKVGQAHDATVQQLAKARTMAKKLVFNLLPEFFLRRMKSLIADQLPKKSDRVVFCPLTETQAEAYENFVGGEIITCIRTAVEMCGCDSGKKSGWCCHQTLANGQKWQDFVFPAIVTLQKLANHLAILIPRGDDPAEKQNKDLNFLQVIFPDTWKTLWRQRDSIVNYANQEFCGKWKILKKLLRFWHAAGDKVLVFSHSVRLLKMLHQLFSATSYNVSYLDGKLSYAERTRVVDDFNADPGQFVFLISTRAGGVGLNITSANKVVIVDPNWNPSHDLQAQDRAYRIGQVRDVEVFRLVSAGTIEEIVYARQIYKQQQANIGYNASSERRYFKGVQNDSGKKGEIFGLANLFAFHGENLVLKDIVNKTNVAETRAGVSVVGMDLDDGDGTQDENDPLSKTTPDDPDGAMSQLASLIESGDANAAVTAIGSSKPTGPRRIDAIQAILSGAGVSYTHMNSEVIGTSKVEERLSRRAQEAVNDVGMAGDYVFAPTQSQAHGNDEDDGDLDGDGVYGRDEANSEVEVHVASRFKPSEDVRKRQFCSMAETFGFSDVTEFALLVESWSQAQRRSFLDKFYASVRAKAAADKEDTEGQTA